MLAEDVGKQGYKNMNVEDCAFILEDLAFQSEIIRCTFYAVHDQLSLDLCKDNQAILYGISDMIWKLDKKMQEFIKQLFDQIGGKHEHG